MLQNIALLCLETVNLELVLLHQTAADEQLADVLPLIALKLQNLSILRVIHHGPVTGKLLLGHLDDLLEVVLVTQALHSGQGLPAVPLLDPDVNQTILNRFVISFGGVSEGIEGFEVLDVGHGSQGQYL